MAIYTEKKPMPARVQRGRKELKQKIRGGDIAFGGATPEQQLQTPVVDRFGVRTAGPQGLALREQEMGGDGDAVSMLRSQERLETRPIVFPGEASWQEGSVIREHAELNPARWAAPTPAVPTQPGLPVSPIVSQAGNPAVSGTGKNTRAVGQLLNNASIAAAGDRTNENVVAPFNPEVAQQETQNALMRKWLAMDPSERGPVPGAEDTAAPGVMGNTGPAYDGGDTGGYGILSEKHREARNRRIRAESKFDDTVRRAQNAGIQGPALARVIQEASAIRSQEELVPEKLAAGERIAQAKTQAQKEATLASVAQRRQEASAVDPIQLARLGLDTQKSAFEQQMDQTKEAREGRTALNEGIEQAVTALGLPEWSYGIIREFSQGGRDPAEVAQAIQEEMQAAPGLADLSNKDPAAVMTKLRTRLQERLGQ